jgi:V-type H+-transporting ATPase subunit a
MEYVSLMVQEDTAHACIARLGRMGAFQFSDLNPELTPFQRRFVNQLKRCDEMDRKIRVFESALSTAGFPDPELNESDVDQFLDKCDADAAERPSTLVLKELDDLLSEKEKELSDLNTYHANLTRELNERIEFKHVLDKSTLFFSPEFQEEAKDNVTESLLESQGGRSLKFKYVTGVIASEFRLAFEKMVFRTTRGNSLVRFADIDEVIRDPVSGKEVRKEVFVIFFQAASIERKLHRICESYGANKYNIADMEDTQELENLKMQNSTDIADRVRVLDTNRSNLTQLLQEDILPFFATWRATILREKAVYHTLNMFKTDVLGFFRGEAWVVASQAQEAAALLRQLDNGQEESPNFMNKIPVHQWPTPPTHFVTNKVTGVFQNVVDTYGIPRYQEANPAPFTMITFPFLFGVMYGDMGHATILWVAATMMLVFEKRIIKNKPGEIFMMAFAGRYMLWAMGLFGIYMGLVYNDVFALGVSLWPSSYKFVNGTLYAERITPDSVYKFGLDPVWHISENELLFVNSLKMKMSVILGVCQMIMGLVLRLLNAIHFRSTVDVVFEAIPQLVFMVGVFGYMNFLIIYKWCMDWAVLMPQGKNPPSLINVLISIVLKPGNLSAADSLWTNQAAAQLVVLIIMGITVPMMLLPKPFILFKQQQAAHHAAGGDHVRLKGGDDEEKADGKVGHGEEHEEHSLGDLIVHQAIETIEFVLGSISNTASYLRLWALSLAHTELATVFWEKAMLSTIQGGNPVFVVVGFAVFAAITTGVLLLMDVLECFLHALRLHWVEFQNKFFKADGYKFEPLDFMALLKKDEEE